MPQYLKYLATVPYDLTYS